ncbi:MULTISPECIES: hypothetical protein [Streptosporangium]|uniref:Repeat protein (TIGR01451 family) n=1 Tax=Streptosporangium brasiliense TaxID=47480 RepID=A0ABT9R1D8_9ACTN|nr:hypothetical protein [Streptosporangium brasiliense]MDP9863018.1 putative repeat protein (TIGR01451 family) [Streptosporangium brasiliense]
MADNRSSGAVRRAAGRGAGAALVLILVALAAPAAASPHRPSPGEGRGGDRGGETAGTAPTLSISVDNGRTSARQGDRLSYTVTVRNTGTADADDLRLTQSLPAGLKLLSADRHGEAEPGRVVWTVDLKAGKDTAFHTTAEVQATPDDLLRLATVACASTEAADRPIVCATHSDELPAGAAAAAAAHGAAVPAAVRPWYLLVAAGTLILVAFGLRTGLLARLRDRCRRSPS